MFEIPIWCYFLVCPIVGMMLRLLMFMFFDIDIKDWFDKDFSDEDND